MNRTAEIIKQSLSMQEVAEKYGLYPDRSGFVRCPFHIGDNTASLKLYPGKGGGFYCFGCKAHGSVIDFVMRAFDCSFLTAVERLNADFGLGLCKQTYREKKAARGAFMEMQRRIQEDAHKQEEAECQYWVAFDLWRAADMMAIHYNPSETGGVILPGYAEAVKSLPQLEYELMLAEERRREFESTSSYPGMGKGKLPDTGAI